MIASERSFPRARIDEIWGNSPIFQGPSWLVSWALSDQKRDIVLSSVSGADIWITIQKDFDILARSENPWSRDDSFSKCGSAGADLACLEAISALSRLLLKPASLEIALPSSKVQVEPFGICLKSDHHELAGQAIFLAAEIVCLAIDSLEGLSRESDRQRIHGALTRLMSNVIRCCSHPLSCAQIAEAKKRDIPVFLIDPKLRLYQFGSGMYGRWVSSTANDGDSYFGATLASNKSKARSLLLNMGLPVPREVRIPLDATDNQLQSAVQSIGFPCVLKPLDQEQGRGATAAIENFMELLAAFHSAKEHTRSHLLLQNHIEGHDYRLNMSRGRLQFVIKRSVPVLVGNGCDTVQDLLEAFNADRRSQGLIDGISKQINTNDSDLLARIEKAGLLFSSVLEAGRSIRLRGSANASNGGIYEDLDPACVHPRIRRQCEAIAQTLRLDVCGIDYISPDISVDPNACPGAFIEVNSMPQNSPKRVSALLNNLFHSETSAHVPCLVLMAGWQVERRSYWGPHLDAILARHPRSVVAIPRELESLVLPLFPSELSDFIHIFSHPREPLLDKSVESVVYLVTPQLVMMKGLPGVIHPVLVSLDSSLALSPKIVWSPFLRQHCAIAQTVSPPA